MYASVSPVSTAILAQMEHEPTRQKAALYENFPSCEHFGKGKAFITKLLLFSLRSPKFSCYFFGANGICHAS